MTNARGGVQAGGSVQASFPAEAVSVGQARRFLLDRLRDWHAARYEPAALSICSELCTNAVLHARTRFTLLLHLNGERLRLGVRDQSAALPRLHRYSTEATTDRGLAVVAAMAAEWGVDVQPDGKLVWAVLSGDPEEPDLSHLFADDLAELTGEGGTGPVGSRRPSRNLVA